MIVSMPKNIFKYGSNFNLSIEVLDDAGESVEISNCEISVVSSIGNTIVENETCVVNENVCSFSVSSDLITEIGINFLSSWVFTVDSEEYTDSKIFHVLKYVLNNPCSEAFIYERYPMLRQYYPLKNGVTMQDRINHAFDEVVELVKSKDPLQFSNSMMDASQVKRIVAYMTAFLCFSDITVNSSSDNINFVFREEALKECRYLVDTSKIFIDTLSFDNTTPAIIQRKKNTVRLVR